MHEKIDIRLAIDADKWSNAELVATTFSVNSRPFDLYGRWGGEEFIGVIRNTDKDDLALIGNRLRVLIEHSQSFQLRINSSFPDGTMELYHFLRGWLVDHIQDCDKKYGPYLKEMKDTV